MKASHRARPPRLAIALLDSLGPSHAFLAGDLIEEYLAGRSRRWLWRQVAIALIVGMYTDIRRHKLLALRAIATGWLALIGVVILAGNPFGGLTLGQWTVNTLIHLRYEAIAAGSDTFVMFWAMYLPFLPTGVLGFVTSGFAIGRLHRSHPAAMLGAFTSTVIAMFLVAMPAIRMTGSIRWVPPPLRLAIDMQLSVLWYAGYVIVPALILFGGTAIAQTRPRDYPQWRGPNRDGSASDFVAPRVWPEQLTRRWKVDVGEGYATPIVVDRTVYAFTRHNNDDVLIALDADTGAERWRTRYPAPYAISTAAAAHGAGPKATPLFHRGMLYTLGISGIVSAFDAASGKLRWQTAAPAEAPYYGTAVSPVADGNLVIVHSGNYGPLTAYDATTGQIRWTAGAGGTFASPLVVDLAGTRQVVTMTQQNVIGVSVSDGTILWQHPWTMRGTPSSITPILYRDTVIVASQRVPVVALRPTKREGRWTIEVAWESSDISLFMSNPVLVRDTLVGLSERSSGQFFALDARTGKLLWLGEPRQATNTAIVKANDLLFLLNDDGELIVARSDETALHPLKRYTVADSATWAQPAISGDRLFIKDASTLALWTVH